MGDFGVGIYYEIVMTLTLRKFSAGPSLAGSEPQSEIVTEFPLLSLYKRVESVIRPEARLK